MIYMNRHPAERGEILAMCDSELIGRILEEGRMVLDLKTYADFYRGELVSEAEAAKRISKKAIFSANIVGNRSVRILVGKGIVKKAEIRKIQDTSFVQIFRVDF